MRPNLSFLSAASNALLKPDGLLRWKKRLVKDARFSLPLTEVMKIARLTYPLLDMPRQSSSRPRLRHGRRLALLFHLNQTLNLYTLNLYCIAGSSSSSSSSPNFSNCPFSQGIGFGLCRLPEIPLFRFSAKGPA